MHILRRFAPGLAVAAAILAASPALCADDPAPSPHNLELARHLIIGMHVDRMMGDTMKSMVPAMVEQARRANPSISQEQVRDSMEVASASMQALMSKMMDRMIPLYASTFTEKELQDAVNFYDSPSGQAMLAKTPILASKMTPIMMDLMPQMQADLSKQMCAKTDCSRMSPPPAPKS